jgi:hypothetical protein
MEEKDSKIAVAKRLDGGERSTFGASFMDFLYGRIVSNAFTLQPTPSRKLKETVGGFLTQLLL